MFEKLNLGMRGHDLNYDTPEQLAKALNKVGATSVQLALKKSFPWIKGEESLTPSLGRYIKKCFDENGVNLSVLGCYINPVAEDDKVLRNQLDWFKANLIFAKYLGADMVGTETGPFNDPDPEKIEANYQKFLSSMKELVEVAEKVGTMIGIEAVVNNTICSPQVIKRFLDDINSPCVCVIFDITNALPSEDIQIQHKVVDEMFELCGNKIGVIHLKDFGYAQDGRRKYIIAGDQGGVVDFEYFLKKVKENCPCIDAIIEEVPEENFHIYSKKMAEIWEKA